MKIPWNKNYLIISFHVIFTLIAVFVIGITIMNLEDVLNFIKFIFNNFFKLASPLIIGLVIAYLLDPIADFFQKKWNQLNSKKKVPSNSKRAAGTAFTYLAILLIILISSLITIKKNRKWKLRNNRRVCQCY